MVEVVRCAWAQNELAIRYHDEEWGVPVHEDWTFFEFLILEGAQAGLSWDTILKKRENYIKAFAGFDPAKVAKFDRKKQAKLLLDPGIGPEPVEGSGCGGQCAGIPAGAGRVWKF